MKHRVTSFLTCHIGHIVLCAQIILFLRCQGAPYWNNITLCHSTRSDGYYCYTAPYSRNGTGSPLLKMNYTVASNWCKQYVKNSSLLVITSEEIQRNVESFLSRYPIHSDTVITDAQKKFGFGEWSWVNGQFPSPSHEGKEVAGLENPTISTPFRFYEVNTAFNGYICEYSEGNPVLNEGRNRYLNFIITISRNETFTWYEARNRCLELGGDLASITNFTKVGNWSWLEQGHKYSIGLHRTRWVWNSMVTTMTQGSRSADVNYTNWENGYPSISNDSCICLNSACTNDAMPCGQNKGRKWRTCDCDRNYTVVCQTIGYGSSDAFLPVATETWSTTSMTEQMNTGFPKDVLIILLVAIVVTLFIIITAVVVLKLRKNSGANKKSSFRRKDETEPNKELSCAYGTVVTNNNKYTETVEKSVYAEIETNPKQVSGNKDVYASIQPKVNVVPLTTSTVYADLDLIAAGNQQSSTFKP